ncbi:MAG: hypothetical protein V3S06_05760 [candidate division Zixibacteria bacterium]
MLSGKNLRILLAMDSASLSREIALYYAVGIILAAIVYRFVRTMRERKKKDSDIQI